MLELLFSLFLGWNLVTPTEGQPVPYYTAEHECVAAIWWWDGQEWYFWDTDMPFTESDFFTKLPEDFQETHGRDGWSEHWMIPGEAYWVYCSDDGI